MPVFTVTTASDTGGAGDGKLSLREAVAAASSAGSTATIVFDPAALLDSNGFPIPIQLTETLVISSGNVSIDGSLSRGGSTYNVLIAPAAGQRLMTIEEGAQVTLRDVKLSGGTTPNPVIGAHGINGANGQQGAAGSGPGVAGAVGTNGESGTGGALAIGGILNEGSLVLERVMFQSIGATAGNGGWGGDGGRGGFGGKAPAPSGTVPDNGGDGGDGGHAGAGGGGGIAVGGVFNIGSLTVRDVYFSNMAARGGNGHNGGAGGWGGAGGPWNGGPLAGAQGGDGGNGGNGGNGGSGGLAVGAIYSIGSVTVEGPQAAMNGGTLVGGSGGLGGSAGVRGAGGKGYDYIPPYPANDGADGNFGVAGQAGVNGAAQAFFGLSTATVATVFHLAHDGAIETDVGATATRTIQLTVEKYGSVAASVSWRVVQGGGITAADFAGSVLPSGQIDFTAGGRVRSIILELAADGIAEGIETLTIELYNPQGGSLGWSKRVEIFVNDGTAALNKIEGTSFSDTLAGASGNDVILGFSGADTLNGGGGNDTMLGGDGNDSYFVYNTGDVVTETNATVTGGIDRILSTVTRSLGANVEQLFLIGTAAINATGNALSNYVVGNGANNILNGLDGLDRMVGGAGNDLINGGAGVDVLTGDAGLDTFVFNTASPSVNRDVITDFVAADDSIRLENAIFTALGAATGTLAAAKFKANATGTATDADDRIVYNTTTGALIYDINGNGAGGAFQFATLSSKPTITAADFFVV